MSIEARLDDVDTSLSSMSFNKISYPFMYIENVSQVEFDYLREQLHDGDIPLMIKFDDGSYVFVKNTDMSLNTIKHLSRFKFNRSIFIKESKDVARSIDEFISLLLFEDEV